MKRLLCLVMLGVVVGTAAADTLSPEDQEYYRNTYGGGWMFGWCVEVNNLGGNWEYWIDYYTNGVDSAWGYWLQGLDVSGIQNYADGTNVRDLYTYEFWGEEGPLVPCPPSIHVQGDYEVDGWAVYRNATPTGPPGGTTYTDRLWMQNWPWGSAGHNPGLILTIRVVVDQQYHDGDFWVQSGEGWDAGADWVPVLNMPPGFPPGDFDHDMDVDDADIDMLCDFIRLGLPYDAEYDISADGTSEGTDGFIDLLDLDYHVHALVETAIGNGTEYGDFNLDGVIDTTDLTRLATNYGAANWKWDDGNANRQIDTDIDNTDLTILATYYGFGVPDVVPEPVTLSLLAMGASGLLARRRR